MQLQNRSLWYTDSFELKPTEISGNRKSSRKGTNVSFIRKVPFVDMSPSSVPERRTLNNSFQWRRH